MPEWTNENIDWYAKTYGDDPSVFAVVAAIPFRGAEDVLDIGCGTGSALRAMAARTSGDLVGVDPYDRMLDHARAATPDERVTFAVAGADSLPFADDVFHIVTAINSTPHWDDLDRGVAECGRVLAPDGLLVVGGEDFTEPATLRERPFRDAMVADGWQVQRQGLAAGAFVILARRAAG